MSITRVQPVNPVADKAVILGIVANGAEEAFADVAVRFAAWHRVAAELSQLVEAVAPLVPSVAVPSMARHSLPQLYVYTDDIGQQAAAEAAVLAWADAGNAWCVAHRYGEADTGKPLSIMLKGRLKESSGYPAIIITFYTED